MLTVNVCRDLWLSAESRCIVTHPHSLADYSILYQKPSMHPAQFKDKNVCSGRFSKLTWFFCLSVHLRLFQRAVLFRGFSLFFHILQKKKKPLLFSDTLKKYLCSLEMNTKSYRPRPCSTDATRRVSEYNGRRAADRCWTESHRGGSEHRGAEAAHLRYEAPPADRPALWHTAAARWWLAYSTWKI